MRARTKITLARSGTLGAEGWTLWAPSKVSSDIVSTWHEPASFLLYGFSYVSRGAYLNALVGHIERDCATAGHDFEAPAGLANRS